jgi:hypothetical protein
MIIAVDFDGTIADHRFPDIGAPVPGVFRWLKRWQEMGARLILWTMRDDLRNEGECSPEGNSADRAYLTEAVEFCRKNGVEFWGHNQNPEQGKWTGSPKVYAHVYVDDAAFGCPLKENPRSGGRPYVDWDMVGPKIEELLLKPKEKS